MAAELVGQIRDTDAGATAPEPPGLAARAVFDPHGCRGACCGCGAAGLCFELGACAACGGRRCAGTECPPCGSRSGPDGIARPTGFVCEGCGLPEAAIVENGLEFVLFDLEECFYCHAPLCSGCIAWRDSDTGYNVCARCAGRRKYKCGGCGAPLPRGRRYDEAQTGPAPAPCDWTQPYCAACQRRRDAEAASLVDPPERKPLFVPRRALPGSTSASETRREGVSPP